MMRRYLGILVVMLGTLAGCSSVFAGIGVGGATMSRRLDAIFGDTTLDHGHWGVLVRSLDTGETLYARNEERLFVPASNQKILTGAAILETLGPDYRYTTTIAGSGTIANGVLNGSLVVIGTGDPTFSERFYNDPRDAFRAWADSLRTYGITRVTGGIIAVDTAFKGPTLGEGWMWDDLLGSSSAPYGALQFNESVVRVDLFPSRTEFQPALVVVRPATQAVRIFNDTRTVPAGSFTNLRFFREDLGTGIVIHGEIASDSEGVSRTLAVHDPAEYFIGVLREVLREQGISIEGQVFHHTELEPFDPALYNAVPIFTHQSPPLREILPHMLKPSQNQLAETMLITVGREMRGEATADGGEAVVDSLLTAWDIEPRRYRMADGSGLSRYDLVSPALIVGVLERMDRSAYRDVWLASLPVGGRDGTLESRMRDAPLLDRVVAKTGTLSGVRSLSGYLTTLSGERIVFSMIMNNFVVNSAAVDRVVETALAEIATLR
jgi:D-alanyl-D-alanine carboxypeptidase/D-alanyl-D-alanine-endopeptidase (penicillin-binding protein 4)